MRHTAQAGLNAANDDWHIRVEFPQAIAVDNRRPFRTEAGLAARRIGILMAHLLGGGELV